MKTMRVFLSWAVVITGFLTVQTTNAFYNPQTGRWLNRDPLDEKGAVNLYRFVANNPGRLIDADGREPAEPTAGTADPYQVTEAQCAAFPWWNKVVGITFNDCKPQLTAWGKLLPKFLQDCVLRHEGVHAKQCQDGGWCGYAIVSLSKNLTACAEHIAHVEDLKCAREWLAKIATLSPNDQLALKCYYASTLKSCKAYKAVCDKAFKRTPDAPSCD